ncbi:MAG: ATPase [Paludibacter sp.]|jgi:N-acetylglucosamine kinase-like BadF-type ATPase|nr:ATPase [Paludibacter sp.]
MKLIADSGSTRTTWQVSDRFISIKEHSTTGINPFYQTEEEIAELVSENLAPALITYPIDEIFFYGAGCAFDDKKKMVANALKASFPEAQISVESDLLGAARGLFGHEKGIACILGTGSNSCAYDGNSIVKNVSPLGFILGDEGSGAVLGKLFIGDCLKNQLPEWIKEKFLDEYELTPAIILERVYKKPFPNRFLASFTPFLSTHLEEPAIFNLVYEAFDAFIVRNLLQYNTAELPIGCIGSIAWYFRDVLEIVASEHQLSISSIEKNPVEGLVKFHG